MSVVDKIFRLGEGRKVKQYQKTVDRINALEGDFEKMSDEELKECGAKFKERFNNGESLDALLPEAFAAVREASKRTLGQRHFDVQLIGGIALHEGNIAEMKTGEGKTLVATCPSFLNAITGLGVHVVTVNDYLAKYQSDLMSRVYGALGMSVGCVLSNEKPGGNLDQYACDITYGTNNTFGFDYLRDNMAMDKDHQVQRGHNFAIIDEVDSILIDEARTPLIISGPAQGDAGKWYAEFARLVLTLDKDIDYEVDEKKKTAGILEAGVEKVEKALSISNLYESLNTPLVGYLNNALRAKELFLRDRDYVVADGEVKIVDEHTGRILDGRRYSDGMHQAIEAKEGVAVQEENQTYATITLQNYFRMYNKLSGMTGTALTEAAEFQTTYNLGVLEIPTNRPMVRKDLTDVIYRSEQAKFNAIANEVKQRHEMGQPVLIGTISVEKSEVMSSILTRHGVKHDVLNAKNHAREASIVAMAGRKGAVTVATNMAGRGTDIMLGGNDEFIAIENMKNAGYDSHEDPETYEKAWPDFLAKARQQVADEREEVRKVGGLCVIGSERHESRRIDNQLQGRAGRQGDPGVSKFYISLEDDLMRLFNTAFVERILSTVDAPEDMPLEHKAMSRSIRNAQGQIESRNFEIRKNVLKYDEVMNKQRKVIYEQRAQVLFGDDVAEYVQKFISGTIDATINDELFGLSPAEWDIEALTNKLNQLLTVQLDIDDILKQKDYSSIDTLLEYDIIDWVSEKALEIYTTREQGVGAEIMRMAERQVILSVLDRKWRAHLVEMDYLKEGIGLRAMAQKDPLVEYSNEASRIFEAMNYSIREEVVGFLFNLQIAQVEPAKSETNEDLSYSAPDDATIGESTFVSDVAASSRAAASNAARGASGVNTTDDASQNFSPATSQAVRANADGKTYPGAAKNAPCPCGSGKKYKLCHGRND